MPPPIFIARSALGSPDATPPPVTGAKEQSKAVSPGAVTTPYRYSARDVRPKDAVAPGPAPGHVAVVRFGPA